MLAKLVRNLFGTGAAPGPAHNSGSAVEGLMQRAAEAAKSGRLNEALELYRQCLLAQPRSLDACLGAAGVLVDLWSNDEAVAAYQTARELAPASGRIFSALLFHLHYLSPADPARLFALHRAYGTLMQKAWPDGPAMLAHDAAPERRVRIGYVSPNLSRHSVGYFIEPVLSSHDRARYEVFCYYNHALSDDATDRMRISADGWREIAAADDDTVARMVRDDRIDILIDLAGHSKGNRLGVFARHPAPVQMTWLGYPDTTGLAAVEYRITDERADSAPAAENRHTETLLRVDDCFLCYAPPADAPVVQPRGPGRPFTFSSFNSLVKLNAETFGWWGKILDGVPGSRLVLKAPALDFPDTVDRVLESLERAGVEAGRVELRGWIGGRSQHLELYNEIDIALDTFPYNGTTTTCEALWMGVPVITLAGELHMSRVGASLLHCAGLGQFVARDGADYVRLAVELARDAAARAALRSELRTRLRASPLLDHPGFTAKLEAQYRHAWRLWCDDQPQRSTPSGS